VQFKHKRKENITAPAKDSKAGRGDWRLT